MLRQPLLHDETLVLRAPTQIWSAADGSIGSSPIHGIYFSDVRIVASLAVTVAGAPLEFLATVPSSADTVTFVSIVRQLDDARADPGVRAEHRRVATLRGCEESLTIISRLDTAIDTTVRLDFTAVATGMDLVKAGLGAPQAVAIPSIIVIGDHVDWSAEDVTVHLRAPGAKCLTASAEWNVHVAAGGSATVSWSITAEDAAAVVRAADGPVPWSSPTVQTGDRRLDQWVDRALSDLEALRLVTVDQPDEQFLAAGAPWFFTLFGRDSIWAARFMLPLGTPLAAQTLRTLSRRQGTRSVGLTEEQPGKILHEMRRTAIDIPSEGIHLPPLYYGTVDATPLWVCLLHDAWRWGMPETEVLELMPSLQRALEWMRDFGDTDGDGLLEYVDSTGRGLSNQGWKDSNDSVQFIDGTLAVGPVALVEVQAYAYEAAMHGADLLEHFGLGDPSAWRAWAARLRERFHASFWIEDEEGAYLAIALDHEKKPVDALTSNLGHVLGTGILDERQAAVIARRLVGADLDSGYGLRTMSTRSAGYWPLSYHGGSVWAHDTAIAIAGLTHDGFRTEADTLIRGLLAAASGFRYRMPELHSGDSASECGRPVPYPAACRPQAWSAAAAISVLGSVLGLQPDAVTGALGVDPSPVVGALSVEGLSFAGVSGSIRVDASGDVIASTGWPLTVG